MPVYYNDLIYVAPNKSHIRFTASKEKTLIYKHLILLLRTIYEDQFMKTANIVCAVTWSGRLITEELICIIHAAFHSITHLTIGYTPSGNSFIARYFNGIPTKVHILLVKSASQYSLVIRSAFEKA